MMKENTKIMGVRSWVFPMVGGPYHKLKYRIPEPLPEQWKIMGPRGEWYFYRKTDLPERKRWPVMYMYDEERTNEDRDRRPRGLEQARKEILFGPRRRVSTAHRTTAST